MPSLQRSGVVADQNHSLDEDVRYYGEFQIKSLLPILILAVLGFLAWAFVAFYEPNKLQILLFIGSLALIFLETIDAGWYSTEG
jgi:hypothetical protein